jgi:hypothetical protein
MRELEDMAGVQKHISVTKIELARIAELLGQLWPKLCAELFGTTSRSNKEVYEYLSSLDW